MSDNMSTTTVSTDTLSTTMNTLTINLPIDEVLDLYMMNQLVCEHKVSEHEILKLKEVKPVYADSIKENISKNIAREVIKKTSFTKKKLADEDTHHFIGRIWCFTTEELKRLIVDARNA